MKYGFRYPPTLRAPYAHTFYVWVLNSSGGTEYITGDQASPPTGRMKDVVACIGPIAWVQGQGLEQFKEQMPDIIACEEETAQRLHEEQRIQRLVQAEVSRRVPPPAEPEQEPDSSGRAGDGQ